MYRRDLYVPSTYQETYMYRRHTKGPLSSNIDLLKRGAFMNTDVLKRLLYTIDTEEASLFH